MIFVTSDSYWNHRKGFLYEPRGFKSIEQHDEKIIENWNSVVSPDDTVYHLGDLGIGTDYEYFATCVKRLNGRIKWIFGNHNKFYCLCGHSHTSDKWKDFRTMKSYHVELDAHHNTPVSLESIKQDIREVQ